MIIVWSSGAICHGRCSAGQSPVPSVDYWEGGVLAPLAAGGYTKREVGRTVGALGQSRHAPVHGTEARHGLGD